jgi:hypothetical protein
MPGNPDDRDLRPPLPPIRRLTPTQYCQHVLFKGKSRSCMLALPRIAATQLRGRRYHGSADIRMEPVCTTY